MLSLFYYKKGVLHEEIKIDKTEVKRAWSIKENKSKFLKAGDRFFCLSKIVF